MKISEGVLITWYLHLEYTRNQILYTATSTTTCTVHHTNIGAVLLLLRPEVCGDGSEEDEEGNWEFMSVCVCDVRETDK